ncbi:MAG TPA: pyruvate dehydrogenase complex E1 component subunit beta [Candidatus Sumerlaeota bacterium]|nr:pyruvate dehydrogenase complex E1 component subunit beta [Candidatus Sumerlaeota bacterium]HMZ51666.1 pyruvate dehydrogenase complex E1 component subunit beta [Candidatus Sumerlaeota bacterium]HNM46991.1 pyruvate dehydrogenase complex E1 component subunit beta [Candidatus Sumerlaeota bacterium]
MAVISFREALNQALFEEMERDDQVFLMGEEVGQYHGAYKVSQGLLDRFGEKRVIDAPITENSFVGLGIGAAHVGMRPIIELMTFNFGILALDQIINNAAKLRYMSGGQFAVPMVIRGPNGAGGALAAQHSQALESQYVHIPGLKVIMPSTPADAKGLLKAAVRDPDPVIFMESEKLYNYKDEVPEDADYVLPIGKADIKHTGSDVTIVTYGRMYTHAVKPAIERLEGEEGISVEVVDPRTLRPLDLQTILESVKKTNRMVLVEESWPQASVGAWICEQVYANAFDYLDAPIERLSHLDVPMPYAKNLEEEVIPGPENVVEAVKAVCYR